MSENTKRGDKEMVKVLKSVFGYEPSISSIRRWIKEAGLPVKQVCVFGKRPTNVFEVEKVREWALGKIR